MFTDINSDAGKDVLWSLQVDVCHSNNSFLHAQLSCLLLMEQCCLQVRGIVWSRNYEPSHLMILGQVVMHLQWNTSAWSKLNTDSRLLHIQAITMVAMCHDSMYPPLQRAMNKAYSWARCTGSRHSLSPSLRHRVATVTTAAAVHHNRPMAWQQCDSTRHPTTERFWSIDAKHEI